LRLVDGLLPLLALLTLSGLFLRAFALAAFLLLLESERGLPVGRLVRSPLKLLLRLRLTDLPPAFFEMSPPMRSVGSSACSLKGPLEPTGRFRTTPGAAMVAAMTSGSSLCFAAPW
jgi:hypothetical protein